MGHPVIVTRSVTTVPVKVATRILKADQRMKYWGYGESPEMGVVDLGRGVIHELNDLYVYIIWDGDLEPTMHSWWELTRWDAQIVAYHENGTQLFVNQLVQ